MGGMLAALATDTTGQQAPLPQTQAVRLTPDQSAQLRLDGLLDEPVWQQAPPANNFRQQEPREGAPASEQTEVRILYDQTSFYVGVTAHDRSPDAIIARILQRDKLMQASFDGQPEFAGDDAIAILLDPFHDHRNAVVFATNPNGAKFEALLTDEGREFNIDWRGVWRVAAARTPDGWSAELAIPFRTLRFPSAVEETVWGFNVYRVIRRKNEEVLWSSWSRDNEGFARVSRAGHLRGLRDLPRPGMNLELKPFLLTGTTRELEDSDQLDTDAELEIGLDVKYEVSPGLLLDATVNTDFAQVEVDDEQVNLTRFDLFFPEKRDFFLENAGIFEFGFRSFFEPPPFLLFFSRQIGIHEDGEVPVMGGARLTGRVGGQTIGFLDVVTDSAFDQRQTNFAVARLKRDVGSSSYVGAMVTDRRATDSWNTAGGVDWSMWPTAALNVQGFAAATSASGDGGEGVAYRLGLDYQTDRLGVTAGHIGITSDATADAGFNTRTDILRSEVLTRITPRPRVMGLRKLDLFWNAQLITRTDGELQDWAVGPAIAPEWNSGESLVLYYFRGFTRLDESFDIGDDVPVPVGDYDLWQFGWFANTSRNRPVVLNSVGMFQGIYDGNLATVDGTLDVAPNANLALSIGYTHNRVEVSTGEFSADIGRLRLSYAFSTRLIANALLQYNSHENELSANIRVNFIHTPGSDLFLVFNEKRGSDNSLWDPAARAAVLKLTYLGRL